MKIVSYDATLREGQQTEGISFSVADKIYITMKLDELGIDYIEAGWPGANPKDTEFFKLARSINLKHSKIVAFGSVVRQPKLRAKDCPLMRQLIEANTDVVTVFGKANEAHLRLRNIASDENLGMIFDSVSFLKQHGKEVIFDAEHFFDGFRYSPGYAVACLKTAIQGGATAVVLCDTNGGWEPFDIFAAVRKVDEAVDAAIGIHAHNDSECAVANTIAAVKAGASHVQCTANGLGERCGNANLFSVIGNLQAKQGYTLIPPEKLHMMTAASKCICERANQMPNKRQPFVGSRAFAHKAGEHVKWILKSSSTYEHVEPEAVGNKRCIIGSDQSGICNILDKAREFGISLPPNSSDAEAITKQIKAMENLGYVYESAEASLELLIRKMAGQLPDYFSLKKLRIIIEEQDGNIAISEATTRLIVNKQDIHTVFESQSGPVNATDQSMRKALQEIYPSLKELELTDYKVRILNGDKGTGQKIRVLCEFSDGQKSFSTVGLDENIIIASREALTEAYVYKLVKDGIEPESKQQAP